MRAKIAVAIPNNTVQFWEKENLAAMLWSTQILVLLCQACTLRNEAACAHANAQINESRKSSNDVRVVQSDSL